VTAENRSIDKSKLTYNIYYIYHIYYNTIYIHVRELYLLLNLHRFIFILELKRHCNKIVLVHIIYGIIVIIPIYIYTRSWQIKKRLNELKPDPQQFLFVEYLPKYERNANNLNSTFSRMRQNLNGKCFTFLNSKGYIIIVYMNNI
jgi:hypothetical protein